MPNSPENHNIPERQHRIFHIFQNHLVICGRKRIFCFRMVVYVDVFIFNAAHYNILMNCSNKLLNRHAALLSRSKKPAPAHLSWRHAALLSRSKKPAPAHLFLVSFAKVAALPYGCTFPLYGLVLYSVGFSFLQCPRCNFAKSAAAWQGSRCSIHNITPPSQNTPVPLPFPILHAPPFQNAPAAMPLCRPLSLAIPAFPLDKTFLSP